MRYFFPLLALITLYASAQSPHIHVDQLGYTPFASKVAVLSDPVIGANSGLDYTAPSQLELRDAETDEVLGSYAVQQWSGGLIDSVRSGDRGWWVDFSSYDVDGSYYLYDADSDQSSAVFSIGDDVYDEVLRAASRIFYYNRCGMSKSTPYAESPWVDDANNFENPGQDTECRYLYDQDNAGLERDLRGGWFDAGDYNKYVTFAYTPVHNLLWAYRESTEVWDDDMDIPESGNGLPDILDEIKWELDWLQRMANPDGSVHIKMGSIEWHHNANYPPSNNTDPRYYGPTCPSASIVMASMCAHAAYVMGDFTEWEDYADDLRDLAESCWDHALIAWDADALEYDCDDQIIKAGDADFGSEDDYISAFLAAAVHLYELTGDVAYRAFFDDNHTLAQEYGDQANVPGDPTSYYDEQWGVNYSVGKDAMLHYGTLPGHTASTAEQVYASFGAFISNDWENYYGHDDTDLYRCYLPEYYMGWGSNMNQATIGMLNRHVLTYDQAADPDSLYRIKAISHIHYLHGVNPLGKLYLSNVYDIGADRCVDEIYHSWFYDGSDWDNAQTSAYGPAPGFLVGGPNHYYTGSRTPPQGETILKAYDDFNDVASESWQITEPAIYYQAAYIRQLAWSMLQGRRGNSTAHIVVTSSDIEVFPNPVDDLFIVKGELMGYTLDIINSAGVIVDSRLGNGDEEVIDVSQLGAGIYMLRVSRDGNAEKQVVQKIIKM